MSTEPTVPALEKYRNRCVSCAYLCYLVNDIPTELRMSARFDIIGEKDWNPYKPNLHTLTCYKALMPKLYIRFRSNIPDIEIEKQIADASCPQNAWQLYQKGIHPEVAYQHEQQRKSFRWTKTGVIIASIGATATLTVIGLTVYNIFFK